MVKGRYTMAIQCGKNLLTTVVTLCVQGELAWIWWLFQGDLTPWLVVACCDKVGRNGDTALACPWLEYTSQSSCCEAPRFRRTLGVPLPMGYHISMATWWFPRQGYLHWMGWLCRAHPVPVGVHFCWVATIEDARFLTSPIMVTQENAIFGHIHLWSLDKSCKPQQASLENGITNMAICFWPHPTPSKS